MAKYNAVTRAVLFALGASVISGCHDSDDDPTPTTNSSTVSVTTDFNFATEVSGTAVKGSLASAMVTVVALNADGTESVIPFRTEETAISDTTSVSSSLSATEQTATARTLSEANLAADNPTITTSDTGAYTVYVDDSFSGNLLLKVTTTDQSDAWVRCDAISGCGSYDDLTDVRIPNDGDATIDFGEWYKDDIDLNTVKVVEAAESRAARGLAPTRSLKANFSVLAHIVATQLIADAEAGTTIDDTAVSKASIKVVQQLLFNALSDSGSLDFLTDISTAPVLDLSDMDDAGDINGTLISIALISSTLQTLAANDSNASLNGVIGQLTGAVNSGNFNSAEADDDFDQSIFQLANAVEQTVQESVVILAAVLNDDTSGLTGVDSAIIATLNSNFDALIDLGLITNDQLDNLATTVQTITADLGCTDDTTTTVDECAVTDNDAIIADIITDKLTTDLATLTTDITALDTVVDTAETAVDTAEAAAATSSSTEAQIISYFTLAQTAYNLIFNNDNINVLGSQADNLVDFADDLVAAITEQISQNSTDTLTTLLTNTNTQKNLADTLAARVTGDAGIHVDAAAALAAATAVAEAAGLLDSAQAAAVQNLIDAADAANTAAQTADAALDTAIATAQASDNPGSLTAAVTFKTNAMAAVTAADNAKDAIDDAVAAAEDAKEAADAFLQEFGAETGQSLVDSAQTALETAQALDTALGDSSTGLKGTAVALYKESLVWHGYWITRTLNESSLITKTASDTVTNVGELIIDVMEEAVAAGSTNGSFVDSTAAPGWTYSFDGTMVLEVRKVTGAVTEFVKAWGELTASGSNTLATFAWYGELSTSVDTDVSIKVSLPTGATEAAVLGECTEKMTAFIAADGNDTALDAITEPTGSCFAVTYSGTISSFSSINNLEPINNASFSVVDIDEGTGDTATGFAGNISHYNSNDLSFADAQGTFNSWDIYIDSKIEVTDATNDLEKETNMVKIDSLKYALEWTVTDGANGSETTTGTVKMGADSMQVGTVGVDSTTMDLEATFTFGDNTTLDQVLNPDLTLDSQ